MGYGIKPEEVLMALQYVKACERKSAEFARLVGEVGFEQAWAKMVRAALRRNNDDNWACDSQLYNGGCTWYWPDIAVISDDITGKLGLASIKTIIHTWIWTNKPTRVTADEFLYVIPANLAEACFLKLYWMSRGEM